MNKVQIIIIIFLSFFLLQNCSTIKEGFTSQKKNSVDEFLVEKKSPLVMPPEFGELPIPGEVAVNENEDQTDIKSLLSLDNKKTKTETNTTQKSTTLEDSILEKIKN
ncbi:DUF3035 domain-containing protein [Candidatus Pelagibacter sp. HIMB1321]|uniref:DUF3035 domain-containing protein n=1 Tax=Candidatus Pelagibacter sp. HIMB1321 TaxID=1388755 RepID=UPI000A0802C9|nr:DUF3035 domain-containing protein [Candidatus Pelagibacter sp. HIMB1321]SMF70564.1 Beta-barrel assembly machine subunit BamF [Candidatus Pelagibacter sp. HIMB1321]